MRELTKDEQTLLIYCEARETDHKGYLDNRNLNAEDLATLRAWNAEDFVAFGRVPSEVIEDRGGRVSSARTETLWCELSEEAVETAQELRRARGLRGRGTRLSQGEFRRWPREG